MRYEQEVDTKLAALLLEQAKRAQELSYRKDEVHRAAGDQQVSNSEIINGRARYVTRWLETFDRVRDRPDIIAADFGRTWGEHQVRRHREAVDAYKAAREVYTFIRASVIEQEALYTGWSRFYLVTNVDGHIHSSTDCSTCTYKTDFVWLPDVSGLGEAAAVEAHGKRLCSVCFPSAPTDWVEGYRDQTRVAVEARKAERDAKRAAKEAKTAAYWADKHYEIRFTHEDGTSFIHGTDSKGRRYAGEEFKGKSLKAAQREVKEGNGYTRKGTYYEAIDLKTGKLAVDRDGKVVT